MSQIISDKAGFSPMFSRSKIKLEARAVRAASVLIKRAEKLARDNGTPLSDLDRELHQLIALDAAFFCYGLEARFTREIAQLARRLSKDSQPMFMSESKRKFLVH